MGLLSSKRLSSLLIAGAGSAALIAAAAPGSASAACTTVTGQGATLQGAAQNLWIANAPAASCGGTGVFIRYSPTGSGAGLRAFGANGGTVTTDAYIGTDEAPNATQLGQMLTAVSSVSSVEVIPVAQAAVSVPVNLPSGCAPNTAGAPLTAVKSVLQAAYESASTPDFNALFPGQLRGTCSSTIVPFARAALSGTTFIFKGYIGTRDTTGNPVWSSSAVRTTATSGADIAAKVAAQEGSVGYAVLADADTAGLTNIPNASGVFYAQLNNSSGVSQSPQVTSGSVESSNCGGSSYSTPGSTTQADWSTVLPSATTNTYPICGLTYDVAYSASYGSISGRGYTSDSGDTVRRYLQWVVSLTGGQPLANQNNYAQLPTAVRTIAATGAALVN